MIYLIGLYVVYRLSVLVVFLNRINGEIGSGRMDLSELRKYRHGMIDHIDCHERSILCDKYDYLVAVPLRGLVNKMLYHDLPELDSNIAQAESSLNHLLDYRRKGIGSFLMPIHI